MEVDSEISDEDMLAYVRASGAGGAESQARYNRNLILLKVAGVLLCGSAAIDAIGRGVWLSCAAASLAALASVVLYRGVRKGVEIAVTDGLDIATQIDVAQAQFLDGVRKRQDQAGAVRRGLAILCASAASLLIGLWFDGDL